MREKITRKWTVVLGTARNHCVSNALRNLDESNSNIIVFLKKDRVSNFSCDGVTIETFQGEISWNNISLLRTLKKYASHRILVVVGSQFSHYKIFSALNLWMRLRLLKKQELYAFYAFESKFMEPWDTSRTTPNTYFTIIALTLILVVLALSIFWAGWFGGALFATAVIYGEFLLKRYEEYKDNNEVINSSKIVDTHFRLPWEGFDKPLTVFSQHLGWKNKESSFAADIKFARLNFTYNWRCEIDENGKRITSANPEHHDGFPVISIYGGAETFGELINNEDTYSWLLQDTFKSHKVVNNGTPDYSTYQMLLMLENEIIYQKPEVVIIAFSSTHEEKNINTFACSLSNKNKRAPSCIYLRGKLICFGLHGHNTLPFSHKFNLVRLLEYNLNKLRFIGRGKTTIKRKTTESLLLKIKGLCESINIKLIIAYSPEKIDNYSEFFENEGFSWCSCASELSDFEASSADWFLLSQKPNLSKIFQRRVAETVADAINKALGDK